MTPTPPSDILGIQARMPPFSKHNVKLFFAQLNAAFSLNKITDEPTKYSFLVSILDTDVLASVSDLILNVPPENPFTALKDRLLKLFENSVAQNTKALLQELSLGDQKPSVLLSRMRELASGQVTDDFLKTLWLQRLPQHIQAVLAVSSEVLDNLAQLADKVSELSGPTHSSTIAAVTENVQYKVLQLQIAELAKKVEELASNRTEHRYRRRSQSRNRQGRRSHSNSGSQTQQNLCYYHSRFGSQARKCQQPCVYFQSGNDQGATL